MKTLKNQILYFIFLKLFFYLKKNNTVETNEFIINQFKELQLNSLELKTNIIKYKKPCVGQCYQVITWVKSTLFPNGFIHSKTIRKKDNKILQTSLL